MRVLRGREATITLSKDGREITIPLGFDATFKPVESGGVRVGLSYPVFSGSAGPVGVITPPGAAGRRPRRF